MSSTPTLAAAIAVTRFGLGARPGEIATVSPDPKGWLLAQLEPAAAPSFPGQADAAARLKAQDAASQLDATGEAGSSVRDAMMRTELYERTRHATRTPNGFRERWSLFWLNHFALQAANQFSEMMSGAFLRDALEPHLFGRFEDMVVASSQHPAMLVSLNQTASVGPDSTVGRAEHRGINENLAREIMELHTLGLGGGYGQADVRELALALTGWRYGLPGEAADAVGRFMVDGSRHQPGERRLLGRVFPDGSGQGEAMLRHLARQLAAYRFISWKLARHFVADQPDPSLVARLAQSLAASDGSLAALARALVEAPEAWRPTQAKFKTPFEHLVSSYRALDSAPESAYDLRGLCDAFGLVPLWAPSARGASDSAGAWATTLGLARRAEMCTTFGRKTWTAKGEQLASEALGPLLTPLTRAAVTASDLGREDAAALVLMSPEFLRR